MKIIHITPFFYPAWAYGGIPRLCFYMALKQSGMGHRVHVVTTDALDESSRQPRDHFEIEGVTVKVLRNLSNRAAYRYQVFMPWGLFSEREVVRGFDIMHIHGHRNFLNTAMAYFGRRAGVPMVLQPNGTLVNIERRRFWKSAYDILFGNRQVRATTGFIAVSEVEKQQFMEIGIPEENIRVIPNGVYIETGQVHLDFKKHYGISGEYILYLGKITPRKGIEHIVQAIPLFKDKSLKLVIAGNDMGYLARVQDQVRKLGAEDRVLVAGLLTGDIKTAALREALYTVYVSRDEIFGLVPFESILCGTPVIVADDSGCGEWIRKAEAGHVIPYGDPHAIAEKVNNRDEKREADLVERGRAYIGEHLTWDKVAARVIEFYQEILRGKLQ
jgi:glycosyltransferase involved in cell wall biosynthesis